MGGQSKQYLLRRADAWARRSSVMLVWAGLGMLLNGFTWAAVGPWWAKAVLGAETVLLGAASIFFRRKSARLQDESSMVREEEPPPPPPYRWFFEGCKTLAEVDERVKEMMRSYIESTPPWNPEAGERWAREAWKTARPTADDLKILLANDPSILQVRFPDLTTDEANKFEHGVDGTARVTGNVWTARAIQTVAELAGVPPFASPIGKPELSDKLRATLTGTGTPVAWVDVVAEAKDNVSSLAHIVRSRSTIEGTFETPIDEFMRELFLFVVEQRVRFMLDREGLTTLAEAGNERRAQLEQDRENERRAQSEHLRLQAAAAVRELGAPEHPAS